MLQSLFAEAIIAKSKSDGYAQCLVDAELENDNEAFLRFIKLARQADQAIRAYVNQYNEEKYPSLNLKMNQFEIDGQLVELAEDWG